MIRNIRATSGKSEFHKFKFPNGKIVSPCRCVMNVDFSEGCLAYVIPYIRTGQEVISGDILRQPRDVVLSRIDDAIDFAIGGLSPGLNPKIRYYEEFSEETKEVNWKNLQDVVHGYQKTHTAARLDHYMIPGVGLLAFTGCNYCYARRKNNSRKIVVDGADFSPLEQQFKEEHKKGTKMTVRLGKSTEAASIFHLTWLQQLFELGLKYRARFHVPSKFMPYEPTIARLLIATQSSIGYSIGNPALEKGVLMWGFDNDYRMQCAKAYADSGVNTSLKLSMDCSVSFDETKRRGIDIGAIVEFLEKNPHIGVQLIPMRVRSNKDIVAVTGFMKDVLFNPTKDMFTGETPKGKYEETKEHVVQPAVIHPDFKKLVRGEKGRLQICGELGDTFYCNSCRLAGFGCFAIPRKYEQRIDFDNKPMKKSGVKKKESRLQGRLKLKTIEKPKP